MRDAKPRGRPRPPGRSRPGSERAAPEDGATLLYGWHPVVEALRGGRRRVRRLVATENAARRLAEELGGLPVEPEIVRPDALSRLLEPDAVHQGLLLLADPLPAPPLDALGPDALLLALDQITDPHNVGAIVRSAAAFGVEAIVTTTRHSPALTGVLAKAASGGLEHVPFIPVRNLSDSLIELGELGFTRIGLDSEGAAPLETLPVQAPLVLVLGAEGKGLRQRTRDTCDAVGRLDMPGVVKSLNVSNAAAIALHIVTGRLGRRGAG